MSLYDLPQEMVIKIMITMQEDYERKLKDLQRELDRLRENQDFMEEVGGSSLPVISRCPAEGCNALQADTNYGHYYYRNCDRMQYCENCDNYWCDKHGNIHRVTVPSTAYTNKYRDSNICVDRETCQKIREDKEAKGTI